MTSYILTLLPAVEDVDMDELFARMDAEIASRSEYIDETEFDMASFREMADAIRSGNRAQLHESSSDTLPK